MSTKYILYGHGGSYNHGVEAITKCTINLLRSINFDCRILLSTHFPEQDKEFTIDADVFLERNLDGKTNYEVYKTTIDAITSNDVLIHVGGDNYCYNNWERYAEIHSAGIKKGAKSVLWGCSIDEERLSDELVEVLRNHSLILARETITYNALIRKGLNNVCKVSDIAFGLEPEVVDLPTENYVVINISPLVCKKNPNIEGAIERLIDYILCETNLSVVLVPHVMAVVDNDYEELLKFLDSSQKIYLVSDKLSASQYKYIISKARFCVAARTHVTIAAYSTAIPTIAIGYSTKARGIGLDLDLEDYIVGIDEIELEQMLLERFSKLIQYEHLIKEKLKKKMKEYKQNICNEQIIKLLLGN